jgi:YfiH family protein
MKPIPDTLPQPEDTAEPPVLTAPGLAADGVRHAFFTREGGVSEGIYASLNTGFGSDDAADAVAENRRRAMAALGADHLNTVYQVHGTTVITVSDAWDNRKAPPEADAMVTDVPGLAIGVLSADCAPVLFCDAGAGVVGAAHAGWRGALAGVAEATVEAMEALGATRRSIAAAIGPAIGPRSYEVGPEFPASFLAQDAANEAFFRPADRDAHHLFDLPGYLVKALHAFGIADVGWIGADTVTAPDRFFSYRRATLTGERDYGRLLSAILIEAR